MVKKYHPSSTLAQTCTNHTPLGFIQAQASVLNILSTFVSGMARMHKVQWMFTGVFTDNGKVKMFIGSGKG